MSLNEWAKKHIDLVFLVGALLLGIFIGFVAGCPKAHALPGTKQAPTNAQVYKTRNYYGPTWEIVTDTLSKAGADSNWAVIDVAAYIKPSVSDAGALYWTLIYSLDPTTTSALIDSVRVAVLTGETNTGYWINAVPMGGSTTLLTRAAPVNGSLRTYQQFAPLPFIKLWIKNCDPDTSGIVALYLTVPKPF